MKHEFSVNDLDISDPLMAIIKDAFIEDRQRHLIRCCAAAIQYGTTSEAVEFSTLRESGAADNCVVIVMPRHVWRTITQVMDQWDKDLDRRKGR